MITRILDLLSQAEALRAGAPATVDPAALTEEHASVHLGGPTTPSPTIITTTATTTATTTTDASEDAEQSALDILRYAVELEDALGYDEPPVLPVPTRLYLGAALLRAAATAAGNGTDNSTSDAENGVQDASASVEAAVAAVAEAQSLFIDLGGLYPNMGRTLLGLWRAHSAAGEPEEAEKVRERFVENWQFSEVWLEDSAHVGGLLLANARNSEHDRESSAALLWASSLSSSAAVEGTGGDVYFAEEQTAGPGLEPGPGLGGTGWWGRVAAFALTLVVALSFVSLVTVTVKALRRRRREQRHVFSSLLVYGTAAGGAGDLGRQGGSRGRYQSIGESVRLSEGGDIGARRPVPGSGGDR